MIPPSSVLSRSIVAQPVTPAVGDRYLIPTAATGAAWAGMDSRVGVYTAAGWRFAVLPTGRFIYVEDETAFYYRDVSGNWTAGVGSIVLLSNSVTLQNVLGANASFAIKVENQTTNAPPASPTAGAAYIIGPSPTGAWAGNAGKLAMCLAAGAFTIINPVNGDTVYDKALQTAVTFSSGTAWVPTFGAVLNSKIAGINPNGAWTGGGSGNYTYSFTTAPTTSQLYVEDSRYLTYAAKAVNNKLIFHYVLEDVSAGITTGTAALALFQDSGTNAVDWRYIETTTANKLCGTVQFGVTAPDALSHVYKVRIVNISSGAFGSPSSRLFRVEEYVQ